MSALADLAILQDGRKKVKNFFTKNSIFLSKPVKRQKKGAPIGAPRFLAAAIRFAFAAAAAVLLPAAAEQDQQNDDPPQITAAETVVAHVTHNAYLQMMDAVRHRSSHVMIQLEKCALLPVCSKSWMRWFSTLICSSTTGMRRAK